MSYFGEKKKYFFTTSALKTLFPSCRPHGLIEKNHRIENILTEVGIACTSVRTVGKNTYEMRYGDGAVLITREDRKEQSLFLFIPFNFYHKDYEESLRDVVHQIKTPCVILNRSFQIIMGNQEAAFLLGHQGKEELMEALLFRFFNLSHQDKLACIQKIRRNGFYSRTVPLHGEDKKSRSAQAVFKSLADKKILCLFYQPTVHMGRHLFVRDKIHSLGMLAGQLAHNLNNILASIEGYGMMLKEMLQGDAFEFAKQILEASSQGKEMVKEVLCVAQKDAVSSPTGVKVERIVREFLKLIEPTLPKEISLCVEIRGSGEVGVSKVEMINLLMNVCVNAKNSMTIGRISIEISVEALGKEMEGKFGDSSTISVPMNLEEDGKGMKHLFVCSVKHKGPYVRLVIRDDGKGIEEEILPYIFQPLFSTKGSKEVCGLGLMQVLDVMVKACGLIHVCTARSVGTTMTFYFPLKNRSNDAVVPYSEEEKSPSVVSRKSCIMVVDDEVLVTTMLVSFLKRQGYGAKGEICPMAALSQFERLFRTSGRRPWDLVIVDQTMEGMTGLEFIEKIKALDPMVPTILCSGYSAVIAANQGLTSYADGFLPKPFDFKKLSRLIEELLKPSPKDSLWEVPSHKRGVRSIGHKGER